MQPHAFNENSVRDEPVSWASDTAPDNVALAALLRVGPTRRCEFADGHVIEPDARVVRIVLGGGLGRFAEPDHLCVAWAGPGRTQFDFASKEDHDGPVLQAIGATTVLLVAKQTLHEGLGELATQRWLCRAGEIARKAAEEEAACIGFHAAENRTAKWLLRLQPEPGKPVSVTQERLAQILGIQRTSVNTAMQNLRHRGLLRCRRGKVGILDLPGLRRAACACDRVDIGAADRADALYA
ncbi:Crp/Fnr family transcriptional regulator [Brevundimonas staleyi]|uniref:Crp/Fnr family transcriptional regulator n=1 Tax=Brevundimonas staleyi TaxID=74326 RepID=A0ABW0FSV0_9CAUL